MCVQRCNLAFFQYSELDFPTQISLFSKAFIISHKKRLEHRVYSGTKMSQRFANIGSLKMSLWNLSLVGSNVTALQKGLACGWCSGEELEPEAWEPGQVLVVGTFPPGGEGWQREQLQIRNKAEIYHKCWKTTLRLSPVSPIHICTLTSQIYALKLGHGLVAGCEGFSVARISEPGSWEVRILGSNPSSVTRQLCDLV